MPIVNWIVISQNDVVNANNLWQSQIPYLAFAHTLANNGNVDIFQLLEELLTGQHALYELDS